MSARFGRVEKKGRRVFNAAAPGMGWFAFHVLYKCRPRLPTAAARIINDQGAISCSSVRLNCSAYEGRKSGDTAKTVPKALGTDVRSTCGSGQKPSLTRPPTLMSPGFTVTVEPKGRFRNRRRLLPSLPAGL